MNRRAVRIPDDVMAYARRGDKIAAIKALREHTGLDLKQAREAIEAYLADPRRDAAAVPAHEPLQSQPIPRRAIVALENGRLVEAVKHLREATGAGLKDAKEHLERHLADNPALAAKFNTAATAERRRVVNKIAGFACVLGVVTLAYLYATGQIQ
jgi:ribosomal protein L7/L12